MGKKPHGETELGATVRGFEIGYLMGKYGRKFTARDVAEIAEMTCNGAYRLLTRVSGSRRVPVFYDETTGEWGVIHDEE